MSSFNMPALGGQDQNMKKVYSYIQMLNEQLRYNLSNITPEDNFTKDSFLKYQETDESISQLEVTMNGFISQFTNLKESTETSIRVLNGQIALKVSKDKLCSEISATSDAITFKTGYLVIDTNNFKLYKDGTASFSGTINGGSININDKFKVSSSGAVSVDAITYADTITTQGLLYTNYMRISGNADVSGTLTANTVTVSSIIASIPVALIGLILSIFLLVAIAYLNGRLGYIKTWFQKDIRQTWPKKRVTNISFWAAFIVCFLFSIMMEITSSFL